MALLWLNPWLSGLHSEAASKRAGGMVSLTEAWITAVGRSTSKKKNYKPEQILYWYKELQMSWLQWSLTHSYWEKILYKNLQHNICEVHKGEKPREKDLQPKMCVQFCGVFLSSILGYLLEGGHNAHNAYCLELVLEMSLHMVQTFCWEEGNKGRRVLWLERRAVE